MKRNRILIADDAELNREMLSEILGREYEFIYAKNGLEAIDVFGRGETVDLVLLDVNMPEMDGLEVLRVMNERHWIEEYPVIIISAEDSQSFINRAFELGVSDYISRPFRSVVVQRRVENTLAMYANQKRLVRLVEERVYEQEKINSSMINIFSDIIEMRNHESGSHTLNVQSITNLLLHRLVELTDRYGLSKSDISLISSLSALHDIGKIKVPEEILNKPGKLTDEEWRIMKAHTVDGDQILSSPMLEQDSKFVITARSICRWHHEKYDGRGYPDGLVGDDIPIAAQVVSMADVYDALTSERCYKPAFSHEQAIKMILNGECGAFNPLLIKCLSDVSDSLNRIKQSNEHYNYQNEVFDVVNEILTNSNLPQDNALRRMLNNERRKKSFFMECCDGILFEYDRLLRKIKIIYPPDGENPSRKVVFHSRDSEQNILPLEYWDKIRELLTKTTREDPKAELDAELRLDGELRPYHGTVMALWPERGTDYISVLGQFKPVCK